MSNQAWHYLRAYYWVSGPPDASAEQTHPPLVSLCGKEPAYLYTWPDKPTGREMGACDTCVLLHFADPEQTESWYDTYE